MDLDVDVAKLKLMKASHQSQQYRLEDNLLKTFPEKIEKNKRIIEGMKADIRTLSGHPLPEEGFVGMKVKGILLDDKENAGKALLETFKDAKGLEPIAIGAYRGFQMFLTLEDFGRDYVLTMKGEMSHRVTLGRDARGNLVRMDNTLEKIPERMKAIESEFENLYQQQELAKAEVGKPFPYEKELVAKTARLIELNTELNLDEKQRPEESIAKEKPSILERIRQPTTRETPKRNPGREMVM